jgi:WD40 repeat protein
VVFSPDGKMLADGGADGTVRVWEAAGLASVATLSGHTSDVTSIAFSPDSRSLVSAADDQTVRLWDIATRRQIGAPLNAHGGGVFAVTFSPDGRTLASAGGDDTARLWDVSFLMDVAPYLCAEVGRPMTRAEWRQHVPPGPAYRRVCP